MSGGVGESALMSAALDTAAVTAAEAVAADAAAIAAANIAATTTATAAGTTAAGATAAGAFDPLAFEGIGQYMAQAPVNPVTQAFNAGNMANLTGNAPSAFQGITELNASQTADLMRNIDPRMVDAYQPYTYESVANNAATNVTPRSITVADASGVAPTSASTFTTAAQQEAINNAARQQALNPFVSVDESLARAGLENQIANQVKNPSFLNQASAFAKEYKNPLRMAGTSLGINALINADSKRYGVPRTEKYTGPLSKFSYNPSNYRPDIPTPPANPYRAQYAAGGPVEMMSNNAAMGSNTMYPMANMSTSSFATPYQTPQSTNMLANMAPSGGGAVNMMSGEPSMQGTRMAQGGQVPSYGFGGFIGDSINDIGSHLGSMFKGGGSDFGNVGPMLEGAQGPSKYDPATQKYVPDNAQPMAQGGIARLATGGFFKNVLGDAAQLVGDVGGGALNFVGNLGEGRVSLAKPDHGGDYQEDYSKNSYTYDPNKYKTYTAPNPNTYQAQYARGGIASLGSYSDGGRMLKGPGDGMSDSIPARIGAKQEARLADGEFVVPADVVSHLGNGSTDAGAKQLYAMMDKVRTARTGRKAQGRQIKPNKYMPA